MAEGCERQYRAEYIRLFDITQDLVNEERNSFHLILKGRTMLEKREGNNSYFIKRG